MLNRRKKLTEDVNAYWFPHRVASDSIVSTVNNINQHDRADEDDACHDDADDDLDAGHDDDEDGGIFFAIMIMIFQPAHVIAWVCPRDIVHHQDLRFGNSVIATYLIIKTEVILFMSCGDDKDGVYKWYQYGDHVDDEGGGYSEDDPAGKEFHLCGLMMMAVMVMVLMMVTAFMMMKMMMLLLTSPGTVRLPPVPQGNGWLCWRNFVTRRNDDHDDELRPTLFTICKWREKLRIAKKITKSKEMENDD